MPYGFDSVSCGNQLHLGENEEKILVGIRGSADLQGPILIGANGNYPQVDATLMVAPLANQDCETPDNSFYVKGNTTHEGNYYHTGNMEHYGDSYHEGCFTVVSPPYCNSKFRGNLDIEGWVHTTEEITSQSYMAAQGEVTSNGGTHVLSNKKNNPFDMPHPNKPGWRLRHVCIEGPEIAVYCRGKVPSNGIIELPSFWEGLINPEDMTINLTPIGIWQELFVKEIRWGKQVVVRNNAGGPIHADYHIIARRLDDDLVVEYEGKTHEDYPNGNEGYSFNFEHNYVKNLIQKTVREYLDNQS